MIKNQWETRKTQRSAMVLQYLKFSKCKTLDELINLSLEETTILVNDYMNHILSINSDSVVLKKMLTLEHFYEVNDIKLVLRGHLFETPVIEQCLVLPFSEFSHTSTP